MRKTIIPLETKNHIPAYNWLNIPTIAQVEMTSEAKDFPIENVFAFSETKGWRAATAGQQIIKLIFDQPQTVQHIWLSFIETEHERTQEFTLSVSTDGGQTFQEIVRQQWNFNPNDAPREIEDYQVQLNAINALKLTINTQSNGIPAIASLAQWRLA